MFEVSHIKELYDTFYLIRYRRVSVIDAERKEELMIASFPRFFFFDPF